MKAGGLLSSFPLANGLAGYRPAWLREDVSAGFAIAAVGLPSAIAYPAIAGLPPETGLYASIAPLVAYAILGSSRQLVVGPDAATMTVLAAAMAAIVATVPDVDRVALAGAIALVVGVMCLLARALRLGMLANFLSRPILIGFFAGISLSILIGQIKRVTGVSIDSEGIVAPFLELLSKADLIHWPSVLLAGTMLVVLQAAKVLNSPVPGPVVVVVGSIALSAFFNFATLGIATVGSIPAGLPALHLPAFWTLPLNMLLLGSAAVFLVSFGSGIVTARSFGARAGYKVDADSELLGFSAANLAAGVTGAFPVTASDSRTAINLTVGGRTQLASIVAAGTLGLILLFLSPALSLLPIPSLGAILIAAAFSLIDIKSLRELWRISRMEFIFAIIALLGPITLGVLQGVIIAVGASLFYLLRNMMFPRDALLGRIDGVPGFYKLHRQQAAKPIPGLTICLIEGSVLFFNADFVERRLQSAATNLSEGDWLIIDGSAIAQIDSTGAIMLLDLANELSSRGVSLGFAELHSQIRGLLRRAGVIPRIREAMVFEVLDDAHVAFQTRIAAE